MELLGAAEEQKMTGPACSTGLVALCQVCTPGWHGTLFGKYFAMHVPLRSGSKGVVPPDWVLVPPPLCHLILKILESLLVQPCSQKGGGGEALNLLPTAAM